MQGAVDPIQLRGARHGILVSVREDVDFAIAVEALRVRLAQENGFYAGSGVSLDLGWRELGESEMERLEAVLAECGVGLLGIISTSLTTRARAEARGHKAIIGRLGLSQHQGRAIRREGGARPPLSSVPAVPADPVPLAPGPDKDPTLMVRRTLRSGQTVRYTGNVVIMGDVNPGATVEAEGDVVVLGSLRGQAHAGTSGREGSVVVALAMLATQLRIGELIWVGEAENRKKREATPMRASVIQGQIRVEPFSA